MSLRPALSRSRHPFSQSYGANLPNSLRWISTDTPWASHPGAPVSVLGTDTISHAYTLFTGTWNQPNPPQLEGLSRLHLLLTITVLQRLQRLDIATAILGPSRCVMHRNIAYGGAGILTCFPFELLQLG